MARAGFFGGFLGRESHAADHLTGHAEGERGHRGHGHHGHHGHDGHHGRGHGRHRHDARRGERLLARAAALLDLSAPQAALLADLMKALKQQRRAMRDLAAGREVAALVATENFDREAARRLLDARIEALRAAGPALVDAAGDFFDALDFDQQQAVRFLLRRLRRRGMEAAMDVGPGDDSPQAGHSARGPDHGTPDDRTAR